jgi:HPr kinase/phosphorylase
MISTGSRHLQVQGTCVALGGAGVLLRGPSGAGKSDLALRLIDDGALLVADDLCEIRRAGERLVIDLPAAVDPSFRGKIERRGVGIVSRSYFGPAPLVLVADLAATAIGRGTPPLPLTIEFLGQSRPRIDLNPFDREAVAILRSKATQALVE